MGEDGHRHLLGVSIGAQETEDSWSELLGELLARGLGGVKLVIMTTPNPEAGFGASVKRLE